MTEWLYEAGIGEDRAALVAQGRIVKARLVVHGAPALGTVAEARLVEALPGGKARAAIALPPGADGTRPKIDVLLDTVPSGMSIGRTLMVVITRDAIPEHGRAKLARANAAPDGVVPAPGPDLLERISASGVPVRRCHPHEPDYLEAAGWSEVLDEAMTGEIAFPGGALRLSPTPAMALFDVDGSAPIVPLALAAATACAQAIVRHDIGGSIGIDFPSVTGRAARAAIGAAIDDALPQPFERTALNGFGFLQIVRRRARASLPELLRADPVGADARAALRQMERAGQAQRAHHRFSPAITARLRQRPDWLAELARRTGAAPILED